MRKYKPICIVFVGVLLPAEAMKVVVGTGRPNAIAVATSYVRLWKIAAAASAAVACVAADSATSASHACVDVADSLTGLANPYGSVELGCAVAVNIAAAVAAAAVEFVGHTVASPFCRLSRFLLKQDWHS